MTDLARAIAEQARCAAYLHDDALLEEYCREYGCSLETARAGAWDGACDWLMEEAILRTSEAHA